MILQVQRWIKNLNNYRVICIGKTSFLLILAEWAIYLSPPRLSPLIASHTAIDLADVKT